MTEEQKKRVHSILYSTDSREELAVRMVKLEELVLRMHRYMSDAIERTDGTVVTTGYTMMSSRVSECKEYMRYLGLET